MKLKKSYTFEISSDLLVQDFIILASEDKFLSNCVQDLLQEETRQKLALGTRLRHLEDEQNRLGELLEEEEEGRRSVEKQLQSSQTQVTFQLTTITL